MARQKAKRAASPRKSAPEKPIKKASNGEAARNDKGQFVPGWQGGPGRKPLGITLAQHVRDIGSEVIDAATGWTRLDAMLRRLYADAMSGKAQAADILLERGWGKVMQPVEVDWRVEARQSGMSEEQANAIYAAMVEAARARLVESGGDGSGAGSAAPINGES